MIRIMILDDDEMYLKKEKDITEQYFAEKNVDCTVTIYQNVEWFLLGLNEEKFDMYILDILFFFQIHFVIIQNHYSYHSNYSSMNV